MARMMENASTSLYRTIVKTKILEDIEDPKWGYVRYAEGDEITEIFGPYVRSWDSRNYSAIPRYRREETGEKDYRGNPRYEYIYITKTETTHQVLTPVFKKTSDDTFVLAHEWVSIA
ncbi:MAG TPA: hypothetical protein VIY48_19250 [Candidatus Paceibacterota bacterium]